MMTGYKGILIYLEHGEAALKSIVYQLIHKALELKESSDCPIYGLLIGENPDRYAQEIRHLPLAKAYLFEQDRYFCVDTYSDCLVECVKTARPEIVLVGGTETGRALAATAAAQLETGLTADCTQLKIDEDLNLLQIRPAFGGDLIAEIITENRRPQMATVRYNTFDAFLARSLYDVEIVTVPQKRKSKLEILNVTQSKSGKSIAESRVVVAIGNGIKKKQDIKKFEDFANKINGVLGSTRGLVEKGFMPSRVQIGLSGNYIKPKILVTFGVSGSIQFMAGIRDVDIFIAVNHDKDARIFDFAHYPLIADMYEVIESL